MKKVLGFSLLELMVVVAILGVLATVAVPRFNIFRARARQSESKANLGVIYTLQEAFQIEHEKFYNGNATEWGGNDMDSFANADGYISAGSTRCRNNKLGFRLANCDKARYGYYITDGAEKTWLGIAHALSDSTTGKRIFPGCDGNSGSSSVTDYAPNNGPGYSSNIRCLHAGDSADTHNVGDSWCMDDGRNLFNYRDIVNHCKD